ncbi:hypothetical protein BDR03DRAFT_982482 [Suillus americanus]|nr:hypothetical protein BDR03DRAFT_982482 [Suillus americanus]
MQDLLRELRSHHLKTHNPRFGIHSSFEQGFNHDELVHSVEDMSLAHRDPILKICGLIKSEATQGNDAYFAALADQDFLVFFIGRGWGYGHARGRDRDIFTH